jgi:hypothetical protein
MQKGIVVSYYVCAVVGVNAMLVPIEAAAQIWTAHPQSTEAIQATLVMVFVSGDTEVRFEKP